MLCMPRSGIYSEAIEDYGSWWMSMLTLFKSMLGGEFA